MNGKVKTIKYSKRN